ncbi:mitochondrial small ribosomal subunit Rsm22-domain-containing protein [Tuber brumale]|nr:mitochondrial small ribosomal subunit Rsm22-domain-containing protein [Tuber brumale]
MLATRRAPRYLRLSKRLSLPNSPSQFPHLHTTFPNRSTDSATPSPQLLLAPPAITIKPAVEEYVRQIREQYGDCLPAGLLEEGEYRIYERYYGRPTRLLQPGETLHHFPPPKTPAEEALYAQVAQRIAHPEAVGAEEEEEEGRGGGDEDLHAHGSPPRHFRAHPLTDVGRFASSHIKLPPLVRERTESVIAGAAPSHLADSAHNTLGGPRLQFSPSYARKRSKHLLTIPLNPINNRMSDMDANVFLTAVMPGLYAQCLSSLTELRKRLGGDWVLGGDGGEPGVNNVLDVGGGGAGVLAWRSVVEAEEETRKDLLSERTGKPPSGPDGKALPAARERSGLRAVVVAGPTTLRQKVSKLLDDTLFIPRVPDIYFENIHYTPGASTEKNNAQPRKLYDLIIATNRLLPIVKLFYRRQVIEQLWSHLNPNGGVLLMIERGTPMGFEAIAYARSTILKDYIKDVGKAFQPLPTTNAHGSANPTVEKGPGAIIAPCTNHEECPMFATGPTDGTRRKDYCRFSQRYERPGYLQRLMEESSKNHEDLEYSYVAFRRGVDHRTDTKNKISPTIDDFGITPVSGEPNTPAQNPYTASQLRNYSLTLPRIILPPIKRDGHVILDVCTPTGSIERWVVPKSLGKPEFRDARKSGWGDLWALGAKSRNKRNIKIGDGKKRFMSKLIAIKDPHGDGVRAIVKDKRTTLLKAQKKKKKEAKKVARLQRKLGARERHAEMVNQHKEEKERRLQKAMTEKEAREMHREIVRMHREWKGKKQREMRMQKKE